MIWFHTLFLPLATLVGIVVAAKKKVPWWKHAALAGGCALMLAGLWGPTQWSTPLLIVGGVVFFVGVPRGAMRGAPPSPRR